MNGIDSSAKSLGYVGPNSLKSTYVIMKEKKDVKLWVYAKKSKEMKISKVCCNLLCGTCHRNLRAI
jgi:hypothetical protein